MVGLRTWFKRKFDKATDLTSSPKKELCKADKAFLHAAYRLGVVNMISWRFDPRVIQDYPDNEYSLIKLKYDLHRTNHAAIFAGCLLCKAITTYNTIAIRQFCSYMNMFHKKKGETVEGIYSYLEYCLQNKFEDLLVANALRHNFNWLDLLYNSQLYFSEYSFVDVLLRTREIEEEAKRKARQKEMSQKKPASVYSILGLAEGVKDKAVIKKAYRKLVMIYHPDRGGSAEMFDKITKAYNTIMNSL